MNQNQDRHQIPPIDPHTIAYLDKRFPDRSPDPTDTEREVWMKAGERRAVRHMLNLIERQERNGPTFSVGASI